MIAPLDLADVERRLSDVEAVLAGLTPNEVSLLRWQEVASIIAIAYDLTGVSPREILGAWREPRIIRVRAAVAWVARQVTGYSLPRIGDALGQRHHTTIINLIRKADILRAGDCHFRVLTDQLRQRAEERRDSA